VMGQVAASKDLWECCGEEETCPLHKAASSGRTAVVQRLLRARAVVHTWDISGSTPVHLAAENGHLEVLHLLLSSNGHVDIRDVGGRRPLHKAAEAGATEAISLLLLGRADVEARDIDGMSPAHAAAAAGTLTGSVLRVLLEGRVDVRAKNRHGAAPVDLAAASGHPRVLRWLRGTELDPKMLHACPIFPKATHLQDEDPVSFDAKDDDGPPTAPEMMDWPVSGLPPDVPDRQADDLATLRETAPTVQDQSAGSTCGSRDVCRLNPLLSGAAPKGTGQQLAPHEPLARATSMEEAADLEERVVVANAIQRNRRHVSC